MVSGLRAGWVAVGMEIIALVISRCLDNRTFTVRFIRSVGLSKKGRKEVGVEKVKILTLRYRRDPAGPFVML